MKSSSPWSGEARARGSAPSRGPAAHRDPRRAAPGRRPNRRHSALGHPAPVVDASKAQLATKAADAHSRHASTRPASRQAPHRPGDDGWRPRFDFQPAPDIAPLPRAASLRSSGRDRRDEERVRARLRRSMRRPRPAVEHSRTTSAGVGVVADTDRVVITERLLPGPPRPPSARARRRRRAASALEHPCDPEYRDRRAGRAGARAGSVDDDGLRHPGTRRRRRGRGDAGAPGPHRRGVAREQQQCSLAAPTDPWNRGTTTTRRVSLASAPAGLGGASSMPGPPRRPSLPVSGVRVGWWRPRARCALRRDEAVRPRHAAAGVRRLRRARRARPPPAPHAPAPPRRQQVVRALAAPRCARPPDQPANRMHVVAELRPSRRSSTRRAVAGSGSRRSTPDSASSATVLDAELRPGSRRAGDPRPASRSSRWRSGD